MRRIVLESERLRVEVLPALGAGLSDFSVRGPGGAWSPLMRRAVSRPAHWNDLACYLLAPWSNRIAGAAFTFGGTRRVLRANWPDGTAIHGDVGAREWRVVDRSPESACLRVEAREAAGRNWPWAYAADVRYEVRGGIFRAALGVTNLDESPMPAGLGFHPYFAKVLWSVRDDVRVRVPNAGRYPATGMIPTGPAVMEEASRRLAAGGPLGDLELDDVFAGFTGGAEIEWPSSGVTAAWRCSPEAGHAVVYTPVHAGSPGAHFCLEPVTMVNDGFNRMARGQAGTGVRVLGPGERLGVWWEMAVRGPTIGG
jgi:aldose 1-epimerase